MATNKEQILRNLEYISGGITAFKAICAEDERHPHTCEMIEDWQDTIYCTIDMIEEDYCENAENN